jgi:phenylalanyl-tRNA synthetase beta chain
MNISFNRLKEFIFLEESPEKIGELLTASGLETEGIEIFQSIKGGLNGLVVGEVISCVPHPNADKLRLTQVEVGGEAPLNIVCGAPNVAVGQKVIVALEGATLYPVSGEAIKIKKGKIRGEISEGMICAEDEIGLGESHDGIMVLETELPNGTPAAKYFDIADDAVISIGLTPNRVDAASHYGVARDLKAILKRDICRPEVNLPPSDGALSLAVEVQNSDACPRYAGIALTNVRVQASPAWLQNFLKSVGSRPINNVVDITNYILFSFGQPLHAFDADKIVGKKIIVRTLPEGTKFTTLDEKERTLSANDLMICDGANAPMCIAGVMGGAQSGVTEKTVNVFLESAYFSPVYVRASSSLHELKTDAAYRFSRGADPNIVPYALQLAAKMITEICDGKIASGMSDFYPNPIENFVFDVKFKNIYRLIGKIIEKPIIREILTALEIEILTENEEKMTVSVPPYRTDVHREADIAEEVLRIYGFNNIELSENMSAEFLASFPEPDRYRRQREISQFLAGRGFNEMMTNSLTSSEYSKIAGTEGTMVKILNNLSEDLDVMRQNLLFSGLEVLRHNINRQQSDLKFFEFGTTYHKIEGKYVEKHALSLFSTGFRTGESWAEAQQKEAVYDLIGLTEEILRRFGAENLQKESFSDEIFDYGVRYSLKTGKNEQTEVAKVAHVRKKTAKIADVSQDVFYAEADWDFILSRIVPKIKYKELSKFPAVRRDLALVLDKNVTYSQIEAVAAKAAGKLLLDINVFSVFEGEQIGEGKKSVAVYFRLQDHEKTLDEKTLDFLQEKMIKAYEAELAAVIRR